jgi:tetratricopeptide (TPR) repeat protein
MLSRIKAILGFDASWRKPFNRALVASQRRQWRDAIREYTEVIRINPRLIEAYFNRGVNYFRRGDWVNAVNDFTETIRLDRRHLRAVQWRGCALRAQRKFDEALADFNKLLDHKPKLARAYHERGQAYRMMGKLANADTDYRKAINLGFNSFLELSLIHRLAGRADLAAKDIEEAVRCFPQEIEYWRVAYASYQERDLDGAVGNMECAIRINPSKAQLFVARAFYHHAMGNYANAISDDMEALKLDEHHPQAHNGLAWILATCPEDRFRDGPKALKHALRAVALGKGESLAYIGTLAAAFAEVGNFVEAVRWAKVFLESNPPQANIELAQHRLQLYESGKPYREEKGKMEIITSTNDP